MRCAFLLKSNGPSDGIGLPTFGRYFSILTTCPPKNWRRVLMTWSATPRHTSIYLCGKDCISNLLGLPRPNFTPLPFRLTLYCRRRRVLDLDQRSVRQPDIASRAALKRCPG